MKKNNYRDDLLAGNNKASRQAELLAKIDSFTLACEYFFKTDFSETPFIESNLNIITTLLREWQSIKSSFITEQKLSLGQAIRQYYNLYEFHPLFDCVDLLTQAIPPALLTTMNDQVITQTNPLIQKLITFQQTYKNEFSQRSIMYSRANKKRYQKALNRYHYFKSLVGPVEKNKSITLYTFDLQIREGAVWSDCYQSIQQLYKAINNYVKQNKLMAMRALTISSNIFQMTIILMGFTRPDYLKLAMLVKTSIVKKSVAVSNISESSLKVPTISKELKAMMECNEINEHMLITLIDSGVGHEKKGDGLNGLKDQYDEHQLVKLESSIAEYCEVDNKIMGILKILLSSERCHVKIKGLYNFQLLNDRVFDCLDNETGDKLS